MFWLAHSAWAVLQLGLVTWVLLDSLSSQHSQVTPVLRAALSFSGRHWLCDVTIWARDGWSTSSEAHRTDPVDLLEEICREVVRGAWQGHIYSVELEGWLERSQPCWVILDPSYVVSRSGAMGCHGDLLFPTSNLFEGILFVFCSLWKAGVTCDTWFGSLVVLRRLKDPCPDAGVTWEFRSFFLFFFFI